MLEVTGLRKDLGSVRLLDGIGFTLSPGRILGVAGTHPISKTTLLRVLAGLSPITSGRVLVDSMPVSEPGTRLKIGYMPRRFGAVKRTTVMEFMEFFGAAFRVPRRSRPGVTEGVLKLVDLWDSRDRMTSDLGEYELLRLAFGRILMHNPALLILDEPMAAFGIEGPDQFGAIVGELRSMGKAILFTCLDPTALDGIADEAAVLHKGRFAEFGECGEVLARIKERGWPPAPDQREGPRPPAPEILNPAEGGVFEPPAAAAETASQRLHKADAAFAVKGVWRDPGRPEAAPAGAEAGQAEAGPAASPSGAEAHASRNPESAFPPAGGDAPAPDAGAEAAGLPPGDSPVTGPQQSGKGME